MLEAISFTRSYKADITRTSQSLPYTTIYHLHTIWLFTVGDLHTTCLQSVLFGLSGAASGRLITPITTGDDDLMSSDLATWTLIQRLPWVFLFDWLILLVAQLSNQSAAGAPEEDALNKPYRPIPSGRISQSQVRHGLMPPAILISLLFSFTLGVHWETTVFMAMLYMYNDFGGAEVPVARQILNGIALALLGLGALKLAAGPGSVVSAEGYAWAGILALLVATTIQTQDFRDMEGDAARGRRTLPLVVGDTAMRWVTVVLMLLWAFFVPWLCGAGVTGYVLSAATAGVAGFSLAAYRNPKADARSYKLWSVWLAVIDIMPWLALLR
ncbi:Fumagillin beta-trans-bergamotene synthase [Apiospora saccharicola]|uniref:Fumagillin beta-trans-bergamotene synthase n=1 Tax=Apiospora saccharicola TaxID=335842 RepID=A0ABR1V979_9PEZI